jgi:hypothetical protein
MIVACALVVIVAHCDDGADRGGEGDDDAASDTDVDGDSDSDADGIGCKSMDILFVIDDSDSMAQEQASLVESFPQFIEVLDNYDPPGPDPMVWRVGVITTTITPEGGGVLVAPEECDLGGERWIDGPGDDVAEKFACVADVGVGGSGAEKPFLTIQMALGENAEAGYPNYGFYRKNEASLLVIVIITDEDDVSGVTATEMKEWLDATTGGEGRYVVVGIAGLQECNSEFGDASLAQDIQDLVGLCGTNGMFGDICEGDLWISLDQALELMELVCDEFEPPPA